MNCRKILENEELKFRQLELHDVDLLYNWENNTAEWIYSGVQRPFSKQVLIQYIEDSVYDIYTQKQLRFIVELKASGEALGAIDLFDFDPNNRRAGVGILIDEKFRGRGFATQALEILNEYAFAVLDLHQLFANIAVGNDTSLKLFQGRGYRIIGCKKDWIRYGDQWLDEYLLQLIKT